MWKLSKKKDIGTIDIEGLIKRIFKDRGVGLDEKLWKDTYTALADGVNEGFGDIKMEYRDNRFELLQKMKRNVATFAAFKNHDQISEMVAALKDPKTGRLRSWSQFRKAAHKISKIHNENWLRAEYNTAVQSSRMARKWAGYQRDAHVYPYLTYKTQGDSRVRPAHQVLDGVTKHINDPFWDKWYPPNGWNCRCWVQPSREAGREDYLEPTEKEAPLEFRVNSGKTGEIFSEQHPFFKNVSKDVFHKVLTNMRRYSLKEASSYTPIASSVKTKKPISVHFDVDQREITENLEAATILASEGMEVKMLPSYGEPKGTTWVDLLVDDTLLVEYKHKAGTSENQLLKIARKANSQLKNTVLDFKGVVIISVNSFSSKSIYRFTKRFFAVTDATEIWVEKNGELKKIKRSR